MLSFQLLQSEVDVPLKTRRTYPSQEQCSPGILAGSPLDEHGLGALLDYPTESSLPAQKKEDVIEHFLSVPSHFTWSKHKPSQTAVQM